MPGIPKKNLRLLPKRAIPLASRPRSCPPPLLRADPPVVVARRCQQVRIFGATNKPLFILQSCKRLAHLSIDGKSQRQVPVAETVDFSQQSFIMMGGVSGRRAHSTIRSGISNTHDACLTFKLSSMFFGLQTTNRWSAALHRGGHRGSPAVEMASDQLPPQRQRSSVRRSPRTSPVSPPSAERVYSLRSGHDAPPPEGLVLLPKSPRGGCTAFLEAESEAIPRRRRLDPHRPADPTQLMEPSATRDRLDSAVRPRAKSLRSMASIGHAASLPYDFT